MQPFAADGMEDENLRNNWGFGRKSLVVQKK
jgi:hypothetical protein